MIDYNDYEQDLVARFWRYRKNHFEERDNLFDRSFDSNMSRPPFFIKEEEWCNIIVKNGKIKQFRDELLNKDTLQGRLHPKFGDMKSSQALTVSIFGNLIYYKKMDILSEIMGEDEKPLFLRDHLKDITLEHEVDFLGEIMPNVTSPDVFFGGAYRVAVECKLTEKEFGPCSDGRKGIKCNGNYKEQEVNGESYNCYKTFRKRKYWKFIPDLFHWESYEPCPMLDDYQLIRTILAACIKGSGQNGRLDFEHGHAVVLYDKHNPEFSNKSGKGRKAIERVRAALGNKAYLLQECTWQEIMLAMKADADLDWLTDELEEKYGFLSG